jgi:hypothetical protein
LLGLWDMSKIKLVCAGSELLQLQFMDIFKDYFDVSFFNPYYNYPKDCVFVVSYRESITAPLLKVLDQGNKLIVSNIWEATTFIQPAELANYLDNTLVLTGSVNPKANGWHRIHGVGNLFWYLDSLWYTSKLPTSKQVDFKNYKPNRINDKLFLLPLWKAKPFRDRVLEQLAPWLADALYSYAERGITLPRFSECPMDEVATNGDRTFEAYWYNHTYFSLSVETFVETDVCELFLTEKTFKPLTFQHPLLSCSMPRTLAYIKQQGFETFDHLFDESYDTMLNFEDRLTAIVKNVEMFDVSKYNDPLTQDKIAHNHARFFNTELVKTKLVADLINPILEFVDAK